MNELAQYPILYSFRRCPYAMRARLAIHLSNVQVELREVVLSNKPEELILCSPKATVPVLCLSDGSIIDQSREIMLWALGKNDPLACLPTEQKALADTAALIELNDNSFKTHLDHYKYADRFPAFPPEHYRQQGEAFLLKLDQMLEKNSYLMGESMTLADIAIFPFIRQFSSVDRNWFDQSPYIRLRKWLDMHLSSPLFLGVMKKYPGWMKGQAPLIF